MDSRTLEERFPIDQWIRIDLPIIQSGHPGRLINRHFLDLVDKKELNILKFEKMLKEKSSSTYLLSKLHQLTERLSNEEYDSDELKPYRDIVAKLTQLKVNKIEIDCLEKYRITVDEQLLNQLGKSIQAYVFFFKHEQAYIEALERVKAYPSRVFDDFFIACKALIDKSFEKIMECTNCFLAELKQELSENYRDGRFELCIATYNQFLKMLNEKIIPMFPVNDSYHLGQLQAKCNAFVSQEAEPIVRNARNSLKNFRPKITKKSLNPPKVIGEEPKILGKREHGSLGRRYGHPDDSDGLENSTESLNHHDGAAVSGNDDNTKKSQNVSCHAAMYPAGKNRMLLADPSIPFATKVP